MQLDSRAIYQARVWWKVLVRSCLRGQHTTSFSIQWDLVFSPATDMISPPFGHLSYPCLTSQKSGQKISYWIALCKICHAATLGTTVLHNVTQWTQKKIAVQLKSCSILTRRSNKGGAAWFWWVNPAHGRNSSLINGQSLFSLPCCTALPEYSLDQINLMKLYKQKAFLHYLVIDPWM